MQWLWCWGNFGMLSQKYHYYFLILAVQLLTCIVYYFPVCQLLISREFTAFPRSRDRVTVTWLRISTIVRLTFHPLITHHPTLWSCTHNIIETFQSGKGSGASQLSMPECARVYPCLTSVGVAPPPSQLLCGESFVFLLSMTVKVRAPFTSGTLFP